MNAADAARASDGLVSLTAPGASGVRVLSCGLFLVLCTATGLVDLLEPLPAPDVLGREAQAEAARAEAALWHDGTGARLLERQLAIRSRVRKTVLPPWSAFLLGTVGEVSSSSVLAGRKGWLFQARYLAYVEGEASELAARAGVRVSMLQRRLANLGIRLLVMPVPNKGIVYADKLPGHVDPRPELYDALVDDLEGRGIEVVDLRSVFAEARARDDADGTARAHGDLFFHTDTHWSCVGAHLAAETVVGAAGLGIREAARETIVVEEEPLTDGGNLLDMVGIPSVRVQREGLIRSLLASGGNLARARVLVVKAKDGSAPSNLHGGGDSEHLLVGTSFTQAAGFADSVGHLTGGGVRIHALLGGGALGALHHLLAAGLLTGLPRTVIWEFPVHEVFTVDRPLARVGDVLTFLPQFPPEDVPVATTWRGHGFNGDLEDGATWSAHISATGIDQPGNGCAGVLLQGTVTGGKVTVTLGTKQRISLTWAPGATQVVLPLTQPGTVDRVPVRIMRLEGNPSVTLERRALVWDLAIEGSPLGVRAGAQGVFRFDHPIDLGDAVMVELGSGRHRRGSVTVRAGETTRTVRIAPVAGDRCLALIDVSGLAGSRLREVSVTTAGGAAVKSVRLVRARRRGR